MKIILAPDKYKGSLTGIQFCNAVTEGILSINPTSEIINMPLADGGDGTIDILDYHLHGKNIKLEVQNPIFNPVDANYFYMESIDTAYIEMAEASGMKLLRPEEQNCMYTTTFGTGKLIEDAIKKGAKTIVLGIGGSATNDCGIGMAKALGYDFLDKKGQTIIPIGKNLLKIDKIDTSNVIKSLDKIVFKVACDVANPLYGPDGAAFVYAAQKGASPAQVKVLDRGLKHFSDLITVQFGVDLQKIKGTGAAGGMGAGSIVFLNAKLFSGIDLVKELIGFDQQILDADWIITGEGKLDSQTLSGKTIYGVLNSSKKHNIPVAALCGHIALPEDALKNFGISYADAVIDRAESIKDAINNSYRFLVKMAIDFAKNKLVKK